VTDNIQYDSLSIIFNIFNDISESFEWRNYDNSVQAKYWRCPLALYVAKLNQAQAPASAGWLSSLIFI
jgi:hypothetical protein